MDHLQSIKWKSVKGYEGLYLISEYGDLKSLERKIKNKYNSTSTRKEKILKKKILNGYIRYSLTDNNKKTKSYFAHRLVAQSFLDNKQKFESVDHLDENKLNNHYSNLEWTTIGDNVKRYKSKRNFFGENNTNSILTMNDAIYIRDEFNRLNKTNKRKERINAVLKLKNGYNVSRSCIYRVLSKKRWA